MAPWQLRIQLVFPSPDWALEHLERLMMITGIVCFTVYFLVTDDGLLATIGNLSSFVRLSITVPYQ